MKYTDQWFKFPIKVYDHSSIEAALKKEEEEGIREDGKWAPGYYRCHPDDIVGWSDIWSRPRTAEDGCHATLIFLKGEEVLCVWNSQKFEDKLNAFMDRVEGELKKMAEEEMKDDFSQDDDNNSITD